MLEEIKPGARYPDQELAEILGISIHTLRARRMAGRPTPKTMKVGALNQTMGSAILEYFKTCDRIGG